MSSICWISLFLYLCYINVDWLNFAGKLYSYQLFIICHIITHELPTIVELSVQSENFHMKTFIPIYYNNAYLRVQKHSVSVGRWFTMFHSFSVISGDTVKAIQLQCCVRMPRLQGTVSMTGGKTRPWIVLICIAAACSTWKSSTSMSTTREQMSRFFRSSILVPLQKSSYTCCSISLIKTLIVKQLHKQRDPSYF